MKRIFICLFSLLLFCSNVKAEEGLKLAENASSAILLEASTGEIIYEKNSHEKMNPASMTKMMSMLLIVENIEKGVISWDEMVTVSERASGMGGSQILLETGEQMSVKDLFKGIAVASGNDAVVAMAEKIGGTEENFVNMMNERAKQMGLTDTNFKNPHGLDEANHYSSAYDMAMIAKELVKHEEVLKYTSIYEDYLRKGTSKETWLVNTNKLVKFYDGVDGLKTGYTSEAGYCLTATAKKNDMRLIAVVMKEPDNKTRSSDITSMLDYGFTQYSVEKLLDTNSTILTKKIDKGDLEFVELVPTEDVNILNKKIENKRNVTYDIQVNELKVPLKKGDIVGKLNLIENNKIIDTIDVTVKQDVKKCNIFELFTRYLKDIITGNINI